MSSRTELLPFANKGFSHHEACEACGSRDNKGVYRDGSTYCFGCHKYTPPTGRRTMMPQQQQQGVRTVTVRYPNRVNVPNPNRQWLLQYINEDEIDEFFFYDQVTGRHVFAYNEGEEDYFYEARSIESWSSNKSIQSGTRPSLVLGKWKESGIVVIVEDIVSAIKVSRQFGAMPLFGCGMSSLQIAKLTSRPELKYFPVWLDDDKYSWAMHLSRQISYNKPSCVIKTPVDPKACADNVIYDNVMEAYYESLTINAK